VNLAHSFGAGGLHLEYLLMGIGVGGVGVWMLRSGADARGGRVMIVIGCALGIASVLVT